MKVLLSALLLASSFSAFSATVTGAKIDSAKKNILINVRYGGGCKKHTFSLKMGKCFETAPVQCEAKLVEKIEGGLDACEMITLDTVKISIAKVGLNDDYFSGGTLTIKGDRNPADGISEASVTLP